MKKTFTTAKRTDEAISVQTSRVKTVNDTLVHFGGNDEKGRECGVMWNLAVVTLKPRPKAYQGCIYRFEAGTYYVADACVTRGGKRYGASFNYDYFTTKKDAMAYIEHRIESARAVYTKRYGKVVTTEKMKKTQSISIDDSTVAPVAVQKAYCRMSNILIGYSDKPKYDKDGKLVCPECGRHIYTKQAYGDSTKMMVSRHLLPVKK